MKLIFRRLSPARALWPVFLFLILLFLPVLPLQASKDSPVIVIDPGHSGENLGAVYKGYTEKELNMTVALAMYDELCKYDNVTVYLTHTDDTDMSLRERAEFAAAKDADFLFCLHFNMSPRHNLFGSEVWISAFDEYYAKGYAFGQIQIKAMQDLGLYSRGVKTKLMQSGQADYYGIIRESRKVGVPCALIEHCHLDHKLDEGYYESTEKLQLLGRTDATSVARYFGLKSEELGVDYSDYPVPEVALPTGIVKPDSTPPAVCEMRQVSCDSSTGILTMELTAEDPDSPLLYYSYSINGGVTWSEFYPWEEGKSSILAKIHVPSGKPIPKVSMRVYNLFDRYTESNFIAYPTFHYVKPPFLKQDP